MNKRMQHYPPSFSGSGRKFQQGKMGYILLWLIGIPIPVLILFYLLRGCT